MILSLTPSQPFSHPPYRGGKWEKHGREGLGNVVGKGRKGWEGPREGLRREGGREGGKSRGGAHASLEAKHPQNTPVQPCAGSRSAQDRRPHSVWSPNSSIAVLGHPERRGKLALRFGVSSPRRRPEQTDGNACGTRVIGTFDRGQIRAIGLGRLRHVGRSIGASLSLEMRCGRRAPKEVGT